MNFIEVSIKLVRLYVLMIKICVEILSELSLLCSCASKEMKGTTAALEWMTIEISTTFSI